MSEQWGVGDKADSKAFDAIRLHGQTLDLIHGEHPHSRSDSSIYARWPSGRIDSFNGHRVRARVEVEEENYLKESELSGDDIRKGGSCKIYLNDFPVYEFFHRDAQWALLRAHHILGELYDLPVRLWDEAERQALIGRKVYYQRHPAVVRYYFPDQGCVTLDPVGEGFPPAPYAIEDGYEGSDDGSVKVDVLDKGIWWWRKKEPVTPPRSDIRSEGE